MLRFYYTILVKMSQFIKRNFHTVICKFVKSVEVDIFQLTKIVKVYIEFIFGIAGIKALHKTEPS